MLLELQEKGLEPLFLVSKTNVLPIRRFLSGRRDLNPQPFTPKINVLPIKLLPS